MPLKPISKRRWKARLKRGLWIPRLVIEAHSLTAPEGCMLVWHETEDFLGILSEKHYRGVLRPYSPDDQKRAWE